MQVTILGLTGQVAKVVVDQALKAKYQIKVLVRDANKLGRLKERVQVVQGNLQDEGAVENALVGSIAVINVSGTVKEGEHSLKIKDMKHVHFVLKGLAFLLLPFATAYSQSSNRNAEMEVRKLEENQVTYLMSGKLAEMKRNWAADYTVNNPFNVVQDAATGPIQTGVLTYTKFERNIEKVLVHDSVVVVMGSELVVPKTAPKGSSHDTHEPIKRRFTNVWMRKDGKWLMIARHASNICPN